MTRMTGPDCVVMCNLINTYIQPQTAVLLSAAFHDTSKIKGYDIKECAVMGRARLEL